VGIAGMDSLVKILNHVWMDLSEQSVTQVNHYKAVVDWLSNKSFFDLLSPESTELILIGCSILYSERTDVSEISWSTKGWELVQALVSNKSILLNIDGCNAITSLVRLLTLSSQGCPKERLGDVIFPLMRFHDTVPVPDEPGTKAGEFSIEGGALFHAQVRMISSISAPLIAHDNTGECAQQYSDWFSSIWKRGIMIFETPKTSSVPILTELMYGLLDILGRVRSSHLVKPLSHVLSFATRPDDSSIDSSLFSLCLSVGEAGSSSLINKPVTGKILSSLIAMHAIVHARSIPKDSVSVSRIGSVIRFSASLIGCEYSAVQILQIVDGWIEVLRAGGDRVNGDLIVRAIGSIAVASGGHFRLALREPRRGDILDPLVDWSEKHGTASSREIVKLVVAIVDKNSSMTTAAKNDEKLKGW